MFWIERLQGYEIFGSYKAMRKRPVDTVQNIRWMSRGCNGLHKNR
jgi:hypothetical protein